MLIFAPSQSQFSVLHSFDQYVENCPLRLLWSSRRSPEWPILDGPLLVPNGTRRAKARIEDGENAAVAWQRGAWYLRAAMSWRYSIA
jgi:hypothetical protein